MFPSPTLRSFLFLFLASITPAIAAENEPATLKGLFVRNSFTDDYVIPRISNETPNVEVPSSTMRAGGDSSIAHHHFELYVRKIAA